MDKLRFHHLKPTPGSTKKKLRKGRGEAGKRGKTAGRVLKVPEHVKQYLLILRVVKYLFIEEFLN